MNRIFSNALRAIGHIMRPEAIEITDNLYLLFYILYNAGEYVSYM